MSAYVSEASYSQMFASVQQSLEELVAIVPYAFTNDEGEIVVFPSVQAINEGIQLRDRLVREMLNEVL